MPSQNEKPNRWHKIYKQIVEFCVLIGIWKATKQYPRIEKQVDTNYSGTISGNSKKIGVGRS